MSANLFALPIKTLILNAEEKEVGQALVYIDYVELQDMEGTAKGRLGFVNIKGCLLYTSPSPRDKRQSRMPSSA